MNRVALALALALLAGCAGEGTLEVESPWVRQPPPGAPSAAGYFTLHNGTDATVTLTGAQAVGYGHVMIHETRVQDGVATMHHASSLDIAPGAHLEFRPGGLHLMLMHAQRNYAVGDNVEIELTFESHAPLTFGAPMRTATH